jgi:hypothetical protein
MGVEVSAYTYIGVYADDAEQYLIEKGLLKEDEYDEKYGSDCGYMYEQGFPLQIQAVSYYSNEGYYVGFEVEPSNYKDFDGLIAKFKEITGDDAEVVTFEQWH